MGLFPPSTGEATGLPPTVSSAQGTWYLLMKLKSAVRSDSSYVFNG